MPGWKYFDVLIAVIGFLVQCGLAYLGLTMTHWKRKTAFGGLVLLGLAFTVVAVKRGVDSAEKVQTQLNQIQNNTEHPSTITLTPAPVIVKPPVPSNAKLQFCFQPSGPGDRLRDVASAPLVNGVVTVVVTAKNVGTAQADNGQIWIQLCDECKFAEEPQGTTMPEGDPTVRRKHFDVLHMGSYFEGTTLKIAPSDRLSSFTIAFKYACEKCLPIDNDHPQKLRVNIETP
jgi:hypothetical protein